jgi:deoxyribodipyrimidine photo-lyase
VTSPARLRISDRNGRPVRPDGEYVLYWCVAFRRPTWNFALDRAARLAEELDRPLVVLEPLRAGYRWASDRFHRFVIEGMRDNRAAFEAAGARYYPYVEPEPGAARGLLSTLARDACVVVTDEFPCFFVPRMQAAAAAALDVRLEVVDGCGLLPLRDIPTSDDGPRWFSRAYDLRRHLQRRLPHHLDVRPRADGLAGRRLPAPVDVGEHVRREWPAADVDALLAPGGLDGLPIDHAVAPVEGVTGGAAAAGARLDDFLSQALPRYGDRNRPDENATSGLSPYLHFGHASPHEVFAAVTDLHDWSVEHLGEKASGQRSGWWGLPDPVEGFLDQLVTWRELGFHTCHVRPDDYDRFESLPAWAQTTLETHAADRREHLYSETELDAAQTHDALWNAAQNQLRHEGVIHNYLRMLWAKKVLEWTESPREALRILIELNNRYALDGRDPNSYSGILWSLGRHDRPWGPERPVFGTVRYMSSANTARKVRVRDYVARWTGERTLP